MLIYIEAITKQQLTNHINKQSLKPMGRWDITVNKAVILLPILKKYIAKLQNDWKILVYSKYLLYFCSMNRKIVAE